MPLPDVGDVHVDTLLSNVSIGWQPQGFFSTSVFAPVTVRNQTDIWPKYLKSYMVRDLGGPGAAPTGSGQGMLRAPGTKARNVSFATQNQPAYYCANYALGAEIPDELRANADSIFSLDSDYLNVIQSLMALRWDRQFIADFFTTGIWGTDITGDVTATYTQWNDYANSTPIENFRTILDGISKNTLGMSDQGGIKVVMAPSVYLALLDHPDIIDRIKYGNSAGAPSKVTKQLLASLFEVDEIVVPKAVYTSDEEGTVEASVTYTRIMDDEVWVGYVPGQTRLTPTAGYLFNWASLASGGLNYVRRGRVERERFDWMEVHAYLDWVAGEAGSGVFLDDMV